MRLSKILAVMATAGALLPGATYAQQYANLARDANLRAGPSRDYPVVAELEAGMSVWVDGCINGYRWCDVTVGPDRGWVYAGNIIYPYQGAGVPLLNYGAVIGIGIVGFSVGDYWDNHYRTRPWYPQRQNWINRPRPIYRPDMRPPFPPGPPGRPDGMHRPPPGQPAVNMPHMPPRPPPPPGQLPSQSRPPGTHPPPPPPPHVGAPGDAQRPPETQRPPRPSRPPEGQSPQGNQRPPQGQRGGDLRPPWDELPGGGRR